MTSDLLQKNVQTYLHKLCVEIPNRRVGSPGNRAATDFFAALTASFGFKTESPQFDCLDWSHQGASLTVGDLRFEAFPSPYSLGCLAHAPLAVVSTLQELEATDITGQVVLMRGEIAREQLMPKNFPFYNPDNHKHIIHLLETKQPLAVLAATSRDVVMVGGQYPFPLFEDGDFDIPSAFMTDVEGDRLAEHAGKPVSLEIRAARIPSKGCNVIVRKGVDPRRRIVIFAHIDARMGTPGAGDNASGVIVLLLLAELLADYSGQPCIELVAMNGEDYYCNPGEQHYLVANAGKFEHILLGVNLDDIGYYKGKVAYSLYECPPDMACLIRQVFSTHPALAEGESWYQGDHGLFLINQVPALALTSDQLAELMAEITHTPRDTPEMVDPARLVHVALALRDLLARLAG